MVLEIQKELEENVKKIEALIDSQVFKVSDAKKYLHRYYNFVRSMEDLEKSRDLWKAKYEEVSKCSNCELCFSHSKKKPIKNR